MPRPYDQPMFYAAVTYSAGILLGTFLRPILWPWAALFAAVFAYAVFCCLKRGRFAVLAALASLTALAAFQVQVETRAQPRAPDLARFTSDSVMITGHVVRSGLLRESNSFTRGDSPARPERRQTIDIETEEITINDEAQTVVPAEFGIRLNIHSNQLDAATEEESPELSAAESFRKIPIFLYGERVQFAAKLREPRNYGNPGSMDYRGYLLSNGIVALASIREDRVLRLPGFAGTRLGLWRSRMRRSLVDHMLGFSRTRLRRPFGKFFAIDEEEAGVLAAMIIGEQSLIQRDTRTDFQRTGTYHILVVSGMNVAILAFVIFWLAKRLRAGELAATVITILLSLLYAYMTDLGSPIVRAALMLSLYLGARLLYRDRFSLNSIGTAALLMLMASPQTLFEASFQLTFLSVVVLSGIIQPLLERTSVPYQQAVTALHMTGYDVTLPPHLAQLRLDLRLISVRVSRLYSLGWLRRWWLGDFDTAQLRFRVSGFLVTGIVRLVLSLFNLMTVAAIMQMALALPMVFYFHRMALMGVPSNMVIVPLTVLLMPIGILATLLSYVSQTLAVLPIAATAVALHGILGTVTHFGGVRFSDFRMALPSFAAESAAVSAFFFAMFVSHSKRGSIAALGILAIFAAAAVLTVPPAPEIRPGVLEITAIDVGQGDSILVVTPDGKTLLIDGGGPVGGTHSDSFDIGEEVVSPYLWSRGISGLDAIALTHGHSDHMGGLPAVIANFSPREFWVGSNPLTRQYRSLLDQAAAGNVRAVHHTAGDEFDFGGAHVRVLAPPPHFVPGKAAKNDDSLVMEIHYGNTSVLLAGDIERKMEDLVATRAGHDDLLKVAHHGSATSTTPELLAAVHPQYAVISVGYRSIFGHPKPEVLARLNAAHAMTFRTDLEGAVTFYLDGKSVTPHIY